MDASEAIRLLRERTEHEVTLPGDIPAIVKFPNVQECILSGGIPMPMLKRVASLAKLGDDEGNAETNGMALGLKAEDIEHLLQFRRELAVRTLVGLFGERLDEVTLETVESLPADAFDALVAIGNREKGNLLAPADPEEASEEHPTEASVPA